jgi:hypothetical protein
MQAIALGRLDEPARHVFAERATADPGSEVRTFAQSALAWFRRGRREPGPAGRPTDRGRAPGRPQIGGQLPRLALAGRPDPHHPRIPRRDRSARGCPPGGTRGADPRMAGRTNTRTAHGPCRDRPRRPGPPHRLGPGHPMASRGAPMTIRAPCLSAS